ncbi:MAG: polyhydroxyalkanoate synthesis repressor PhaR [Magnetococcales bacterium]|nr:polyhydroxyalkanoate synthesis repressor PhaR [Magnetococcales bacterium]MBF0156792.1 polyhydroxyalkanoate synthesis repressor PhaR [Magnetococcales bacterium]
MEEPRIIKKYPNRRLYDTATSQYITLEGVRALVLAQTPFQVVDNQTGEDITRGILLQIISEQEEKGMPLFSNALLSGLIHFQGDALQSSLTDYLEKSLLLFVDQQAVFRKQLQAPLAATAATPLAIIHEMAERHFALWKTWQESLFPEGNQKGSSSPE